LRRAQKVTGIGDQSGERLDEETVRHWRKGRISCRRLWLNFGTAVVVGSMMTWEIDNFWAEGGAAPDPQLARGFGLIVAAAVTVGLLGTLVSLLMSAANNKKHLGQFRVTL
jgi:hypothetical protein